MEAGRLPTLKFSSKKFYDNMVNTHLIPVFENTQLRMISKDSVQSFLNAKAQGDSSWKTVKHIRTVIGSILEAAVRDDLLASNPVRKTRLPRRAPAKEKAPISPDSLRALLEKLPEPSRSIAWLLAMTGLRIGELLALRWQDVDFKSGFISVRQSVYEGHFDVPKSTRSRRTLPLGPVCAEILLSLRRPGVAPAALVFASAQRFTTQSEESAKSPASAHVQGAGVDGGELALAAACPCHAARCRGRSPRDGAGAFGDASPEMTREVYIGSVPENARTAVEQVEKLLGPEWTQIPDRPEMTSTVVN